MVQTMDKANESKSGDEHAGRPEPKQGRVDCGEPVLATALDRVGSTSRSSAFDATGQTYPGVAGGLS